MRIPAARAPYLAERSTSHCWSYNPTISDHSPKHAIILSSRSISLSRVA